MTQKPVIEELIGRYLTGEASPEEAMLLEDWKQESDDNFRYFEGCVKIFEGAGGMMHQDPDAEKAWKHVSMQVRFNAGVKPMQKIKTFGRIAATFTLLIVAAGVAAYFLWGTSGNSTVYIANLESRTISLEDGSNVTISPHSMITLDKNYGKKNRLLHLKGSGYFEVIHDTVLPLTVDAGHVYVMDVGTKFNVTTSPDTDTVYVNVDEGVVLLFDSLGSEITIKAGEKALYIKSSKKLESTAERSTRRFEFSSSRLDEVVGSISKAYHINIVLEHAGLAACTITTRFSDESIETVLAVITETLGLTYEAIPGGFIIKGKKCNQ